jgi:hypothetical protein
MTESKCNCVVKNRLPDESQREWFKRWMCQWHWMETDYYQNKLEMHKRNWGMETKEKNSDKLHKRSCPAYGNYQPPYEECNCGTDK